MAQSGHRCLRLQNRRQTGRGQPCRRHAHGHLSQRPHRQHRGGRTACRVDRCEPDNCKLQVARMDEMGCEFVETTAHGGARPSHAEWQGRRFHRGGAVDYKGRHYPDFEAATGYGTGAGLCGWNCRHQFFACFPELGDPPQWTQEQLRELTPGTSSGTQSTPPTRSPRCSVPGSGTSAAGKSGIWPRTPPG